MKTLRVTASGNAIAGVVVGSRLRGVALMGGSAASSAVIYDAATAAGTPILSIKALTNDYKSTNFGDVYSFRTGLSVTLTGAAAELYLFLD